MARTKRRLQDEDDASSEEEAPQSTSVTYSRPSGGGKQLSRMMGGRPGGGKQMRYMPEESESDSSSGSEEEEEEEEEVVAVPAPPPAAPVRAQIGYNRGGGGKQLRGGGKQLRQQSDSEEESSEGEEELPPPPMRIQHSQFRGGKTLRPQRDSEDESSEEEEEPAPPPIQVTANRAGGGKSLRRASPSDDESSDSEESEEEQKPAQPTIYGTQHRGGGKTLRRPEPDESEESAEEKEEEIPEPPKETVKEPEPEPEEKTENDNMDIDSDDDEEEAEMEDDEPVKAPPPTKRKVTRKAKDDSDDSDDMEESEEEESEEEESEEEEYNDGYDDDDGEAELELDMEKLDQKQLIKDEEDRKYLDSLPEMERESILGERFEKFKSDLDMKKALRESNRQKKKLEKGKKKTPSKPKAKGKAPTKKQPSRKTKKPVVEDKESDEDEESMPDTSNDRELAESLALSRKSKDRDATGIKAKKKNALEKLRQAKIGNRKGDDDSASGDESDFGLDGDDSDESDAEYIEPKPWESKNPSKASNKRPEMTFSDEEEDEDVGTARNQKTFVEAEVADYALVTIPRRRLSRWCNEPYFEDAITHHYVRLAIGRDKYTAQPCYRLCKIIGIEKGREYQFPPPPKSIQKPIKTNKWVKLKFADSVKNFKMIMVSDSKPTEEDVKIYASQLKNRRREMDELLSKKEAQKMRKKQDQLVNNYTYTSKEIEENVKKMKSLTNKIGNIGAEKTKADTAVKAAQTALEEAKREVKELEADLLEAGDEDEEDIKFKLDDAKKKIHDEEQKLQKALEEEQIVLKAEEKRKNRKTRNGRDWGEINRRAKEANKNADTTAYQKERKGNDDPSTFDPYARRRNNPKILWEVGQDDDEEEKKDELKKAQVNSEKKAVREENDAGGIGKENSTEEHNGQKSVVAESFNDLAIEEEPSLFRNGIGKKKVTRVRKGLSIQEYFERKEAGTLQ